MVDDVARALCNAAGRSLWTDPERVAPECSSCEVLPDGRRVCVYWHTFRGEAQIAIAAVRRALKRGKRWPANSQ